MDRICGYCHHYIMHQANGPWCTLKRREVSFLQSPCDNFAETGSIQDDVQTKICKRCGRALPLTAFGRHSRTKDGYQPLCNECLSEQNKGHRPRHAWKKAESALEGGKPKRRGCVSAHPDYIDEETGQEMHWCGKCKQYKQTGQFNRNRANASGLESYCKECSVAHERERRARKREERKAALIAKEEAAPEKKPVPKIRIGTDLVPKEVPVVNELMEKPSPAPVFLANATDKELVNELRSRGYIGNLVKKKSFVL